MKKRICFRRVLLLALLTILLFCFFSCAKKPPETVHHISFTELGIPSEESYPKGDAARCPWDMIVYESKLYLGGGDFDKNAGPVTVYCYDTQKEGFSESGTLPEEEINRFLLLDGTLLTVGVDPKEDWSFGNYYTLEEGVWVRHRTLPNGIHNFDFLSFEGALFAGLGVAPGGYPVVRSTDGGESFGEVAFEKDGKAVDTVGHTLVRTYDLFVFDGALYATLSLGNDAPAYELYRYDGERNLFVFASDLSETVLRIKYNHMRITSNAVHDDTLFLVTGRLYAMNRELGVTELTLPGASLVCDLYEDDGKLYFLTAAKEKDGRFKTSVWQLWGEDDMPFVELFNFLYDVPPVSLAVDGEDFYLGMGNTTAKNEKNGTVLHVEYSN